MFSNIATVPILRIYHTKNLGNWNKPSLTEQTQRLCMWTMNSNEVDFTWYAGLWSDQQSRGKWPGSEHRGLTVRNLLFVWVVSQPYSQHVWKDPKSVRVNGGRVLSVEIEIKREFEACSVITGMRLEWCVLGSALLKPQKTMNFLNGCRRWPRMYITCNLSQYAESENTASNQVHSFYFILIKVVWGPRKLIAKIGFEHLKTGPVYVWLKN